jgi:cytochrome c oxidase assembly factor 6
MQPPSKTSRTECYQARDAYFECLDKHKLWLDGLAPVGQEAIALDPVNPVISQKGYFESKTGKFACHDLKLFFESQCLPSWARHFNLTRVRELQKLFLQSRIEQEDMNEFWKKL